LPPTQAQVIVKRMQYWARYDAADPKDRCDVCRSSKGERRATPIGILCLECWLDLPSCDECGYLPVVVWFRGRSLCHACANPDPDSSYVEDARQRALQGTGWLQPDHMVEDV